MQYKWPILSQKPVINFLEANIQKKQLANSYVFVGIKDLSKFNIARYFASNIFISENPDLASKNNFLDFYSDFIVIEREADKKNISIEQIRILNNKIASSSVMNSYKIAIVKDAHFLNENSANALLKSLEDYKDKLIIILTVNDDCNIPATIVSRSRLIHFSPLSFDFLYEQLQSSYKLSPSKSKELARVSLGRPALLMRFLEDEELYQVYKDLSSLLLDFVLSAIHQRIILIDQIVSHLNDDLDLFDILDSILRDLLFVYYDRYDFVRNEFLVDRIKKINQNPKLIHKSFLVTQEARTYLKSNMSLKSVLDYVAINI